MYGLKPVPFNRRSQHPFTLSLHFQTESLRERERKRNNPRVSSGRRCVRARFDAVEMPLKRMKKSRNARKKPL
jgi:hypothetical protein